MPCSPTAAWRRPATGCFSGWRAGRHERRMKSAPIVAAKIGTSVDGLPLALDFGDVYHPRSGALAQASHVFLAGNGLPERWRGRSRFVIAETGFGLGNNF